MVKVCKYLPSLVEIKHYDAHIFVKFSRKLGITTPKRAKKCSELLEEIHSFYTHREGGKSQRCTAQGCKLLTSLREAKRVWHSTAQPLRSCASSCVCDVRKSRAGAAIAGESSDGRATGAEPTAL